MGVFVDQTVLPDIEKVKTVRVLVAKNQETGKEGVASLSLRVDETRSMTIPVIWSDDDREGKMRNNIKNVRERLPSNISLEIRKFRLIEDDIEKVDA